MAEKLFGVIPPMITPFNKDDNLDETALKEVVKFLFKDVHGYFICGTYAPWRWWLKKSMDNGS
jgi:dihydrodipicolinate synthase/N-acetylneuraminate lyase